MNHTTHSTVQYEECDFSVQDLTYGHKFSFNVQNKYYQQNEVEQLGACPVL